MWRSYFNFRYCAIFIILLLSLLVSEQRSEDNLKFLNRRNGESQKQDRFEPHRPYTIGTSSILDYDRPPLRILLRPSIKILYFNFDTKITIDIKEWNFMVKRFFFKNFELEHDCLLDKKKSSASKKVLYLGVVKYERKFENMVKFCIK